MKQQTTTEAVADTTRPIEHPAVTELRRALGSIELDVMTSYTLADAIREGSSVTRQRIGGWLEEDSACAIAAGFVAARARGYAV